MHSIIVDLANGKGFTVETSKLRAFLFPLMKTITNAGTQSLEGAGHSISMFRFQETWYLQDDNIGIAKPLPQFDPEHFIKTKGNFFISSYTNLLNKSDLIEQGFFTEQDLRQGKAKGFGYYGYKYRNGEYFKEKILFKESISYNGRFDAGTTVLVLCVGELDPESIQGVANQCKTPIEELTSTSTSTSKPLSKVKDLPPDLIAQLTLATPSDKRPNKKASVSGLRKNIQANFNAFTTTRKGNSVNARNTTRKVKAYTNVNLINQFTAF